MFRNGRAALVSLNVMLCLVLGGCGGGSGNSATDDNESKANLPPVFESSEPITVKERDEVIISVQASDPDGYIYRYEWRQKSGLDYWIDADSAEVLFKAPATDQDETLVYTVTAYDNEGLAASQDVEVNILSYGEVDPKSITDPELEKCLRVRQVDLGTTELDCEGFSVKSLDGLEALTFLTHFTPGSWKLENMDAIASLTSLEYLDLSSTKRLPLTLGELPNLRVLDLSNTQIPDLPAILAGLPTLTSLKINNYDYAPQYSLDLSNICLATQLESLEVAAYSLVSTQGLKNCTGLRRLSLNQTDITSINFLDGGQSLIELDLAYNPTLTDIDALSTQTSLEKLNILGSSVVSLAPLAELASLQEFALGGADALWTQTNLEPLANLRQLTHLLIHGISQANGLDTLEKLNALRTLELSGIHNLTDVDMISSMGDLQELLLSDIPELRSAGAISSSENLEKLIMKGVGSEGIPIDEPDLSAIASLRYLDISDSFFAGYGFITGATGLETLRARFSVVVPEFPELSAMTKLQTLEVGSVNENMLDAIVRATAVESLHIAALDTDGFLRFSPMQNLRDLEIGSLVRMRYAEGLEQLTSLENISFIQSEIEQLPSLAPLKNLVSVHIYDSWITELSALNHVPSLYDIFMPNNRNLSCQALDQFILENPDVSLYTGNCAVSPTAAVEFADVNLKRCAIQAGNDVNNIQGMSCFNRVTNVDGIEKLKGLVYLSLSDIADDALLQQLEELDKLDELRLSGVEEGGWRNLSNIPVIPNLSRLFLGFIGAADFNSLNTMETVQYFDIDGSMISTLAGIDHLPHLLGLGFWNSSIADVSALYNHESILSISFIESSGVSCEQLSELIDRDISVSGQEQCWD